MFFGGFESKRDKERISYVLIDACALNKCAGSGKFADFAMDFELFSVYLCLFARNLFSVKSENLGKESQDK